MSYIYSYKLKNVGGQETIEEVDLHNYLSIQLNQKWLNNKLLSTYKLTDRDGYVKTLDFDDRESDAFDFFDQWQQATKTFKNS